MSTMRLDKYLAQALRLSRSAARALIRSSQIEVDGQPCRYADASVDAASLIRYQGQRLSAPDAAHGYWMLHKPTGYLSATRDDHQATVLDLLPGSLHARLQVAGRLDKESTGLLLLTTDGSWSHRLRRPGRHSKVYLLQLAEEVSAAMVQAWLQGVELHADGHARALGVECLDQRCVRMTIDEGRYHQVRRMCVAVGNHVLSLHREQVAGICLDPGLAPGQWRALRAEEVASVDA